jgi:hypothetical protein
MESNHEEDPLAQWERFLAASRGDMRIQVVKRAINQGALAGFDSRVTDYAAWLVIDALDSFDADADQRAYAQGFRQGVEFGKFRYGKTD